MGSKPDGSQAAAASCEAASQVLVHLAVGTQSAMRRRTRLPATTAAGRSSRSSLLCLRGKGLRNQPTHLLAQAVGAGCRQQRQLCKVTVRAQRVQQAACTAAMVLQSVSSSGAPGQQGCSAGPACPLQGSSSSDSDKLLPVRAGRCSMQTAALQLIARRCSLTAAAPCNTGNPQRPEGTGLYGQVH